MKNRSKIGVKMGSHLSIDFYWILMDLGSQVGAKLGEKIEPRQAKTGQDKASEGKGNERKRKGREGNGEVWKSVE